MAGSCTYAGIPLVCPNAEIRARIEQDISPNDIEADFQSFAWPGKNRAPWTFPGWPATVQHCRVKLNSLWWPPGASRFAVGRFLATSQQLASIRPLVYPGGLYVKQPLVMSDGTNSITVNLWMLPPRPLYQIAGQNQLYLLTLVDDRYFWWLTDTSNANIIVTPGTTTFSGLYSSIVTALGSPTFTKDTISTNYLSHAAPELTSHLEALPLLFDAVAYNVGQRIIRNFDGSIEARSATTYSSYVATNLAAGHALQAGGQFLWSPVAGSDLPALEPAGVTVTYPKATNGAPVNDVYLSSVTLASLGLMPFAGLATASLTTAKVFHDVAVAETDSGTFQNQTELDTNTKQAASDWYLFQLGLLDTKFAGIVNWRMDGFHTVEWTYHAGECSTRVQRAPWNDTTEELLHYGTYGAQNPGAGQITTTPTGTDVSFPGSLTLFLGTFPLVLNAGGGSLTLSGGSLTLSSLTFAGGGYSPTGARVHGGSLGLESIAGLVCFTTVDEDNGGDGSTTGYWYSGDQQTQLRALSPGWYTLIWQLELSISDNAFVTVQILSSRAGGTIDTWENWIPYKLTLNSGSYTPSLWQIGSRTHWYVGINDTFTLSATCANLTGGSNPEVVGGYFAIRN